VGFFFLNLKAKPNKKFYFFILLVECAWDTQHIFRKPDEIKFVFK